ncbi:hypothetical protein AADZ91_03620 [Colwelliaceae bacterium 6441]
MKLDDLKQEWQQTVNTSCTEDNLTEVITALKKETTKIDKEIKRRDFLEISISIFLTPFWIFGLINSVSTMQTLGCWIALITSFYIPYKLVKAKQVPPTKNTSIKAFLLQEKQKLLQQKQLLESIVWWYIAPITTSIVLITLGATVDSSGSPMVNEHLTFYYGCLILLIVGIYFLNKRAAKKKFTPMLNNVEQRIAELATQ